MLQRRGAHQLPTCGKMSLLGPGLGADSRGMKRSLAPPPAVCKQGHVELIQHRACLPQYQTGLFTPPRTGGRYGGGSTGKGNFRRENQP